MAGWLSSSTYGEHFRRVVRRVAAREKEPRPRCTTTLDDTSILRGTSAAVILHDWGHELRTSPDKVAIDVDLARTTYSKSFHVTAIDVFMSHSWRAPCQSKYLSLLFHFNGIPALLVGILFWAACVIAYALLEKYDFQDNRVPIIMLCVPSWLVTFVIFLFWQDLVAGLRIPPRRIFFDKVCIHQADAELKLAGISRIGGFIGHSKHLLVAWDASYFSRLWCPFEIAAFKFARPNGRIIVLPVEMGKTVTKLAVAGFTKAVLMQIAQDLYRFVNGPVSCSTRLACRSYSYVATLLPYLVLAWELREHATSLLDLEARVSKYSVRQAECFCCSNFHVHPDTGAELPCDRELVYESIAHWYGSENRDRGLDRFDKLVREMCTGIISNTLAMCGVPYRFILFVSIWRGLAMFNTVLWRWKQLKHLQILAYVMGSLDVLMLREPMIMALIFVGSRHLLGMTRNSSKCIRRVCTLLPAFAGMGCQVFCAEIATFLSSRNPSYLPGYFLWMFTEALVVWLMYSHEGRCTKPSTARASCDECVELASQGSV